MTISANRTIAVPGTIAASPPPQNAAAVQAVQAAIAAADTPANGVDYGPFAVQVAPASSFNQIWINNIAFYQFAGFTGPWLPLGDVIGVPADNFAIPGGGVLCFAPSGDPAALVPPVGFRGVVGDQGSGNSNNVEYWWPVAPAGYTALGLCFNNSYDTPPDPANYWCVKTQYLQTVTNTLVWSDQGAGWDGDGNLFAPAFSATPETPPEGGILLLPPTLLSGSDLGNEPAFALVGTLATLDVTPFVPPAPASGPNAVPGDTTTFGLGAVVVMPYTAVPGDAGFPNQATSSPFYYVASEPYWACTMVLPTPAGGSFTVSETVGVSQTQSQSFAQTTTISVSAEFGAELDGLTGKVSASLTDQLELQTASSTTGSTEVTTTTTLNFPPQPTTWIWVRYVSIEVFRGDGSQLFSIDYSTDDLTFVPDGPEIADALCG